MRKFLDVLALTATGFLIGPLALILFTLLNQSHADKLECSVGLSQSTACAVQTFAHNLTQ